MVAPSCLTPERDIDHLIRLKTDQVYADICRQVEDCLTDDLLQTLERTPKRRQRKPVELDGAPTDELKQLGSWLWSYRACSIIRDVDGGYRPQNPKTGRHHKAFETLEKAQGYIDEWWAKLERDDKIPAPDDAQPSDGKADSSIASPNVTLDHWLKDPKAKDGGWWTYYRGCMISYTSKGYCPQNPKTHNLLKHPTTFEDAKAYIDCQLKKMGR